ncbi:MAG: LD-carboxypeptidase [Burkholderiaceae bacterium]|nr:LD-carboxypeptidase [Burkholderiaceae bacterium]
MTQHIYIYSPSSAVRNKPDFRRGVARLKALGHEVEIDVDALSSSMRFAGDDATRIAAIHRAAASGADVAMISRGGYGLTRILSGIDYKALARAVSRGTRFVGLSDFTALQCALWAKASAPSWAGPALGEDFGTEGAPDDIMQDCFEDMLCGRGEGVGWRLPKEALAASPVPVRKGVLWGGNLSVLVSLVGTPWMPQVKGGILFLEDVHEHPYRIERMLTQLLHAGVLGRQKAVLLGQFNHYKLTPHDRGYKLATVVAWLRSQLKVPVLTDLPFGHVATKVCLPVGAQVSLAVEGRDAFVLWGHGH